MHVVAEFQGSRMQESKSESKNNSWT
jgi:hypothetical protein